MTDTEFPEPDVTVESVSPEALKERIDGGEEVFILDTRAESEFAKWRIEGETVRAVNVPYYEFLIDEPDDEVFDQLPEDQRMTVLCAKGEASAYVAGVLKERGYDVEHLEDGMNGWASVYEYVELDVDLDATIAQYQRPSSGCLAYLVVDGDEAAVIDPLRAFAEEYVRDATALGADLIYAVDTHAHADHVSGVREVAAATGGTVVVPEPMEARGLEFDVAYETVADGDELVVGETVVEAVHTPGHTTDMTAYRVGNVLFTGDGLFTESVARPDLEEGDEGAPDAARQLYDTLQEVILPMPDETLVAPAHYSDSATPAPDGSYTARLGDLKASMDVLSMDREEFVEFVLSDMPPRPSNYEKIIPTNLGQRETGDEEAFELELGPNNCAASKVALTSD